MKNPNTDKRWCRITYYVIFTTIIQAACGVMLLGTMYNRGPMSLLFLLVMTNIAYPWLLQHTITVSLWPYAILVGSLFMFLSISTIGEATRWLSRH